MDESNRLSGLWAKTMGAFDCDDFRIFTKEKLRKFVEQQLMEKDKKVVFLEKQLKEKKVARNRSEIVMKKSRVQVLSISMISMLKSFDASPFPMSMPQGNVVLLAGDWSQVHLCLPRVHEKEMDLSCSSGHRSCSQ
uniref:Uncharacterized protein n=1 Tax=Populus alba TaxID=43335 RepID=A0A4U5QRD6_POPAL|nr:hypothetical protein D5086_0000059010 [Populus alba]